LEKQKHRQESSIDKQVNNLFSSLDESPFDHEKLDVYGVELGFVAWLVAFLDDASNWSAQHRRELIEQLDRASLSVLRRPSFSAVSRWSERNSRLRCFLLSYVHPFNRPQFVTDHDAED